MSWFSNWRASNVSQLYKKYAWMSSGKTLQCNPYNFRKQKPRLSTRFPRGEHDSHLQSAALLSKPEFCILLYFWYLKVWKLMQEAVKAEQSPGFQVKAKNQITYFVLSMPDKFSAIARCVRGHEACKYQANSRLCKADPIQDARLNAWRPGRASS